MKISQVIARLQKIQAERGDVDVMLQDPESSYGPWAVTGVHVEVAEEDQYPEDFQMPEGYTFVEITG